MTAAAFIPMQWDGDALAPLPRFRKLADDMLVVGTVYNVTAEEQHSAKSRAHLFAAVRDAWMQLPAPYAERFKSPDALRKYATIKAGFYRERSVICPSNENALAVAGFIRPMDEFAIVNVQRAVVTVYTAKSLSAREMGREEFQAAKRRILEILDDMLGTAPGTVEREAGRAA